MYTFTILKKVNKIISNHVTSFETAYNMSGTLIMLELGYNYVEKLICKIYNYYCYNYYN